MIGTTLGHNRVGIHLGRGGMGEVWKARGARLGRTMGVEKVNEQPWHPPGHTPPVLLSG
jgi:hypothetical protein